ncbi:MAG: 50S ribosomal protein L34e [Candidatus Helarchaeota archaeon]
MPEPQYRSRSKRRKRIKVPGGKGIKIHYTNKRPAPAKCAVCKKDMYSIPRKNNSKMKNLPKVQKRPTRMYGGYLCPSCLKDALKKSIRSQD